MNKVTRVHVINSVDHEYSSGFKLALEWCLYSKPDEKHFGYRFIWKKPDGNRLAHRGQAAIQSKKVSDMLWKRAVDAGWGNYDSDKIPA